MNTHNSIQIVTKKTIKLQKLGKKTTNGNDLKVSRYFLPEAVVVLLMGV